MKVSESEPLATLERYFHVYVVPTKLAWSILWKCRFIYVKNTGSAFSGVPGMILKPYLICR